MCLKSKVLWGLKKNVFYDERETISDWGVNILRIFGRLMATRGSRGAYPLMCPLLATAIQWLQYGSKFKLYSIECVPCARVYNAFFVRLLESITFHVVYDRIGKKGLTSGWCERSYGFVGVEEGWRVNGKTNSHNNI